jgi:DNA invertase Pin-like site-specific DNA recombinase
METTTLQELQYIRYSRKSSEAKEKQIASIRDQNAECDEHAAKLGLRVVAKLQEEHSAFKPNKREKFTAMIEAIKSGNANAILTWKPDRICRNPLEGGIVLQLLQDGIIKEIRTPLGDVYTPDSDHLILQIHFGMANQYSRLLSQNVKRGLSRKAKDRHEYPKPAPLGFEGFGERGQRNIRPHPLEAPLILKAFKLAATGVYSLNHILDELHEAGLRTKKDKKISKSHMRSILVCPTYYGNFYHNGELCEGNYEAIISKGLFDLVQEKLKDRSRPKNIVWVREFTKLFRCGTCGCAITTTIKRKFVKSINDYRCYSYHHCTKRRGNCKESQLSDDELKKIVLDLVDSISIDQEVWRLGLELVRAKHADEVDKNKHALQYVNQQNEATRDQINKLVEMRTNGELTKEEFLEQKERLTNKLDINKSKVGNSNDSMKTWLELIEEFLNTAFQIREIMIDGLPEQKQTVLNKIGENFLISGKKLTFSFKQPYVVLLKPEYRTNVLPV